MEAINQIQDKIIDEFSMLDGDLEMSSIYLMEHGEKLPAMDDGLKTDDNLVKGCQSLVWLFASLVEGKVTFQADSNSAITKGLVSLLIRILTGQIHDDIINSDLYFVEKIGMNRFIGTQRSNGFAAMVKQIKLYAVALKAKVEA